MAKSKVVKINLQQSRAQLIDSVAERMYIEDFNITMGGSRWSEFTTTDKSLSRYPYTIASKYMKRAEVAITHLERLTKGD